MCFLFHITAELNWLFSFPATFQRVLTLGSKFLLQNIKTKLCILWFMIYLFIFSHVIFTVMPRDKLYKNSLECFNGMMFMFFFSLAYSYIILMFNPKTEEVGRIWRSSHLFGHFFLCRQHEATISFLVNFISFINIHPYLDFRPVRHSLYVTGVRLVVVRGILGACGGL